VVTEAASKREAKKTEPSGSDCKVYVAPIPHVYVIDVFRQRTFIVAIDAADAVRHNIGSI